MEYSGESMKHNPAYWRNFTKEFSIRCSESSDYIPLDFHFHDVFEIYFAMTDGVTFFVDDKIYPVKKGDLFIFNDRDLHKAFVPPGTSYMRYTLTFKPEYILNYCTQDTDLLDCFINREQDFSHRLSLDQKQSDMLVAMFDKAKYYRTVETYGADVHRKMALAEILLYTNTLYQSNRQLPSHKNVQEYERIRDIIRYIRQNTEEKLSLDFISKNFFISKSHLGYLFKNATGFSVNEYIIHHRILKARELLKKGFSVTKVAEMIGYKNDSHFIRTFKNLVGIPPKQYMKRNSETQI